MNKKPVYYKQSDRRWSGKPYRVPGETSTIGSAGCGPSCAAMVIASLKDRSVTPETTCAWSVAHGYKALKQGTYYSYFKPQMAAYGIECEQLLGSRILNQPDHPVHGRVQEYLRQGDWIIALMGPGTWTKGGHFVLVWDWDSKVRILDPASSASDRLNGDPGAFRREVRCYWRVNARDHNKEDDMTGEEIYNALNGYFSKQPVPAWAKKELEEAVKLGITDGKEPMALIPRYQAAIMAKRAREGK